MIDMAEFELAARPGIAGPKLLFWLASHYARGTTIEKASSLLAAARKAGTYRTMRAPKAGTLSPCDHCGKSTAADAKVKCECEPEEAPATASRPRAVAAKA